MCVSSKQIIQTNFVAESLWGGGHDCVQTIDLLTSGSNYIRINVLPPNNDDNVRSLLIRKRDKALNALRLKYFVIL